MLNQNTAFESTSLGKHQQALKNSENEIGGLQIDREESTINSTNKERD